MLKRFFQDEKGATAIEYGLIAALIAVACITALTTLGENTAETFDEISDAMEGEAPAASD